jgi:dihydroorotate dehydrogenase
LDPEFAVTLFEEAAKRKKKPLFIKIPGYISETERRRRLNLVECIAKYPVDGITITPESRVEDKRLSVGRGTITGRPLIGQALQVIEDIYETTAGKIHIRASGGISNAHNAFRAISAGATTVEVVTGFLYEGWNIAHDINQGLIELMDRCNIQEISAFRGAKINP